MYLHFCIYAGAVLVIPLKIFVFVFPYAIKLNVKRYLQMRISNENRINKQGKRDKYKPEGSYSRHWDIVNNKQKGRKNLTRAEKGYLNENSSDSNNR